jgi:hypothetical protein
MRLPVRSSGTMMVDHSSKSAWGVVDVQGAHRCGAQRVHLTVSVEVQFRLAAARHEVTLDLRAGDIWGVARFNPAEMAGG